VSITLQRPNAKGWLWATTSAGVDTCDKLKQITKATRPTTIQMVTFDAGYSGAISITSPGVSDHQNVRRVRSWELAGCNLELGADVLVHGHIRLHQPNLGTERIAIEPRQQIPGYRAIRATQVRAHANFYLVVSQKSERRQRILKECDRFKFDLKAALELSELSGGQLDSKKISSPLQPTGVSHDPANVIG